MSRGGQSKAHDDGPERRCIVTGESQPRGGLLRFVLGPDGQLAPDLMAKRPGRGIWITADRASLTKAVEKGLFGKAARTAVTVPDELPDLIEALLARRVVDLISLARKSGDAVAGYEKVKSWLDKEEAQILIQANDGSARGKSKLSTPHHGNYIGWLSADELGVAFGRQTVIHAALRAGGLANRVVDEALRLKGMRVASDDQGLDGRGRRKG
jgi:predicted RNA-binding protein YlxR (DUF448 family)